MGRRVTWTKRRCINALHTRAAELGRIPTSGDWPSTGRPDLPSYATLQTNLGATWRTITALAFPSDADAPA